MRLQSAQPRTFSQLLEVLKDNITDVLMHFHPDSIKIRSADHAKTFICYVNIRGGSLEQYHCERYQPVGINMARLWTVLKIAAPDDILKMDCEEGKGVLDIKIIDSTTDTVKLSTNYITYDCDEEAMDFPENINFGSCISMSSILFYSNLKDLESLGAEYVKLRQCKAPNGGNRLQLIGIGSSYHKEPCMNIDEAIGGGGTTATNALKLKRDEPDEKVVLQEIEMVFPLKKLVQFAKAHCLDSNVGIHLDEKGFLILQYDIKIYGELRFVVAATRDDDDDAYDDDDDDDEDSSSSDAQGKKRPRPRSEEDE